MKTIVSEAIHDLRGSVRYLKELKEVSRQNRKNPTRAELKIWNEVLRKRRTDYLFLRQKPIHRFVLDFYCSELNLAIEIDGGSHEKKKEFDQTRDDFLAKIGIKTIRFSNNEILENLDEVKKKLHKSLPCQREMPGGQRD